MSNCKKYAKIRFNFEIKKNAFILGLEILS
jgi:hypothetical protein